jgi:hypothetical protein
VADGIRTRDHRDHNPGLYQLSYRHRGWHRIAAAQSVSGRAWPAGIDPGGPRCEAWPVFKSLAGATRFLVLALSALYIVAGFAGAAFLTDSGSATASWLTFLVGGAVAMLLGTFVLRSPPWLSAALVSLGASVGGLPLFWTVVVPLAAVVVMASSIALARQRSAPA